MSDAALDYAARGWPVFPVWWALGGRCACGNPDCPHPAKHPIGKLAPKGRNSATTNSETIKKWWMDYPEANIGIPTGPESGLVVVDVDPRNGGDASLKELERQGNFPSPPRSSPEAMVNTSFCSTLGTAITSNRSRGWEDSRGSTKKRTAVISWRHLQTTSRAINIPGKSASTPPWPRSPNGLWHCYLRMVIKQSIRAMAGSGIRYRKVRGTRPSPVWPGRCVVEG